MMLGPREIADTPIVYVWAMTFGVVTTPVWLPWYGAVFLRHGKDAANAAVYGPPPPRIAAAPPTELTRPSSEGLATAPDVAAIQAPPDGVPRIEFGRYRALIIGVSEYSDFPRLETPVSDASAIAAVLSQSYGFETVVLEDATRGDILGALTELRYSLDRTDNLLVYYAGHGYVDPDTGEGYWLPTDAKLQDAANWVSNSDVSTAIKAMEAKHVLVVADSCFSGSLSRYALPARSGSYLQKIARKKARLVLTSGGLEPVADAGDGVNSVFAVNFLRILRENRGVLEGSQLFSEVRRTVMQDARQTPEYAPIPYIGHDGGDFLFVRTR
jgi:hypothetical protein